MGEDIGFVLNKVVEDVVFGRILWGSWCFVEDVGYGSLSGLGRCVIGDREGCRMMMKCFVGDGGCGGC